MTADLSSLTREAIGRARRATGLTGNYYATEHVGCVAFDWNGDGRREALRALVDAFDAVGISATDVPWFGVQTGLEVLQDTRPFGDHEAAVHNQEAATAAE